MPPLLPAPPLAPTPPSTPGAANFNYTVTAAASGQTASAVVTVQIPACGEPAVCEGCLGPQVEGTFVYEPNRPGFPATARSAGAQLAAAALPAAGSRQAAVDAVSRGHAGRAMERSGGAPGADAVL